MKCISLFGRNLITLYEHNIMSVSVLEIPKVNINDISVTRIEYKNLKKCEGGSFSTKIMRHYLEEQCDKAEGYLFTVGGRPLDICG